MKKTAALLLLVAALAGGVAVLGIALTPTDNAPSAIDTPLSDLDGNLHTLAEWHGQVVLVNFWATWCAPCREELPLLTALQRRYRDRGFTVVGIAIDRRDAVADLVRIVDMDYPLLVASEAGMNLARDLGNDKGALPFSVLLDRSGRPVMHHAGVLDEERTSAALAPLL